MPRAAQRAHRQLGRDAGPMATARVVVSPPAENGGRRVLVDGEFLGVAFSLRDVAAFLERAGLEGWDELDVARHAELIEWQGGGPDVWGR